MTDVPRLPARVASARYLAWYASTTLAGVVAVVALNVVADTHDRFGTPRWRHVNDAARLPDDENTRRPELLAGRRFGVRRSELPIVLVGTSTTMFGFDTRRLPGAFNAGLPGMTLREGALIATAAFDRPHPARTVLLEAVPPGHAPAAEPDLYDWTPSLSRTRSSLRVVVASARANAHEPRQRDFFGGMAPVIARTPSELAAVIAVVHASFDSAASVPPVEVARVLTPLWRTCATAGGTLVLYLPPRHPRILASPALVQRQATWLRTVREASAAIGDGARCPVSVRDLSSDDGGWNGPPGQPPWTEADFTSVTHFHPSLGERVYARLIGSRRIPSSR